MLVVVFGGFFWCGSAVCVVWKNKGEEGEGRKEEREREERINSSPKLS